MIDPPSLDAIQAALAHLDAGEFEKAAALADTAWAGNSPLPLAGMIVLACQVSLLRGAASAATIRRLHSAGTSAAILADALNAGLVELRGSFVVDRFLSAVWNGTAELGAPWRRAFLQMACELAAEPEPFRSLLGAALLEGGQRDQAVEQLRKVIGQARRPLHLVHYRDLGLALRSNG